MSVQERVQAGIDWLDKNAPDWRTKISLSNFSIVKPCILDQVFGDYTMAIHDFDLNATSVSLGFSYIGWEGADELEAEWRRRLA